MVSVDRGWLGRDAVLPPHSRLMLGPTAEQVHIRVLGHGSPLVMLHMSPLSSAHLLPLAALVHDRTCVVVDLPGHGLSDPMPADPQIVDFSVRVLHALESWNLGKMAIYGSHTGAKVALGIAAHAPHLVSALVLDGLRLTTDEQRCQQMGSYAPPVAITSDGSHLLAMWQRIWETSPEWIAFDRDSDRCSITSSLLRSQLAARPWYGVGYHAAFRCDPRPWLELTSVPALLITRSSDLLGMSIAHVSTPANVVKECVDDSAAGEADVAACISDFLGHADRGVVSGSPGPPPNSSTRFVSTTRASVQVTARTASVGRDAVVRVQGPAWPSASDTCPADIEIALPGSGPSEWRTDDFGPETMGSVLADVLDELGIKHPRLCFGGLTPAVLRLAGRSQGWRASDVDAPGLAQVVDVLGHARPRPSGEHLTDLWHALRLMFTSAPPAPARHTTVTDCLCGIAGLTVDPSEMVKLLWNDLSYR